MVSGRHADFWAHCSNCGRETILNAYENRRELICPACLSDKAGFTAEKQLMLAPVLHDVTKTIPLNTEFWLRCEGCAPRDPESISEAHPLGKISCEAGPPIKAGKDQMIPQCDCCKWIPRPFGFYWNGHGECCQPKFDYVVSTIKKRDDASLPYLMQRHRQRQLGNRDYLDGDEEAMLAENSERDRLTQSGLIAPIAEQLNLFPI